MTRPRGAHPTSQTAGLGSVMGRTVSIVVRCRWPLLRPMGGCVSRRVSGPSAFTWE